MALGRSSLAFQVVLTKGEQRATQSVQARKSDHQQKGPALVPRKERQEQSVLVGQMEETLMGQWPWDATERAQQYGMQRKVVQREALLLQQLQPPLPFPAAFG